MNIHELVSQSLLEDIPQKDVTTTHLGVTSKPGKAELRAKEDLVLSGTLLFLECLEQRCPNYKIKWYFNDGDFILNGQTIALIEGNLLDVLQVERVALNFLGQLSGIATLTRCFVEQLDGTACKILDTRKTTPLMRDLEKMAVVHGGGYNHRRDLSAEVMIKENHIQVAGSLEAAVLSIREQCDLRMTVEVKNLDEVKKACELKVDRIMFDNMNNETIKQALKLVPSSIEVEASGNMTLDRVRSVAQLGVHCISVGAITHSAPCADISLLFHWKNI